MAQVGRPFTGHRTEELLCTQHTQSNKLFVSQTLMRWWLDTDLQAATLWGCGLSWSESLGWDLIFVRTTHFFPCSITFSGFSTATSLGLSCNLWSSSSMWLVWLPVFLYESVFCTFLLLYKCNGKHHRATKNTLQALVYVFEWRHETHTMSNISSNVPATIRIHRLTPAIKRTNC